MENGDIFRQMVRKLSIINMKEEEALPKLDTLQRNKNGKYGYIDEKNHWVIQPEFIQAKACNDHGIAAVESEEGIWEINSDRIIGIQKTKSQEAQM